MYKSVLPRVLSYFDIKYRNIRDYQSGYRNEIWPVETVDGKMINITFYKREDGILDRVKRADAVSAYLNECGMPTKTRYDNRTLIMKNGNQTTAVAVYNYLPGDTISWEAYTMEHIKTLGASMSDMHHVLASMSAGNSPSVYDEYLEIVSRMRQYFAKPGVKNAMKRKLGVQLDTTCFDQYQALLTEYEKRPCQQVLHMDFVRGNILFQEQKIAGILDFEKTAFGHTAMDIARTLAFLLVDCKYKTNEKVRKYFLHSGYQKRGKCHDIGDDNVREKLVQMFLTYDFYKFLLHNPYESLAKNEHYTRTRDILVLYGVIS